MKNQNQFSMRRQFAKAIIAGAVMFGAVNTASGQTTRPAGPSVVTEGIGQDGKVRLVVNRSQLITTKGHKRVNVAQPEVADVNLISPTALLVTAKKPGSTQLILWDDNERAQVVEVVVDYDLQALNDAFKKQFPNAQIDATAANGSIILRGRVPNLDVAEQAVQLAAPYASGGGAAGGAQGKVMNFLEIAGGQQVMLQVRFAEVSRTASNELGFHVAATDGTFTFGGGLAERPNPITGLATRDAETSIPTSATVFGGGRFGNTAFEMLIAALRENSLLRVLAEPNLTAISGQEANFLAGGEIPIPVPQDSGGGSSTITIEYKQFGVGLRFVPVVLGDGRIRLKCAPEVSDLDFTNAVTLQGFRVPAITKRSLSTTVELKEGQTLALAGLLNSRITTSSSVVPLLGDIPVLGALFRSQSYNRQETELVVLVTPRLVSGLNNDQLPALPGEKWRTPTEGELFWLNDLGGELPATKKPVAAQKPARFQGTYGFSPVQTPAADKEPAPANTAGSAVSPAKQGVTTVQPTTKATGK